MLRPWRGVAYVILIFVLGYPKLGQAFDHKAWSQTLVEYTGAGGSRSPQATAILRRSAQALSNSADGSRNVDTGPLNDETLVIDEDVDYRRNYEQLVLDYAKEALNDQSDDDTRIIGGRPTSNYRDTVAIAGAPGQRTGLCSGVLISTNVILTAAHCSCAAINDHVTFGTTSGSFEGAAGAFFLVEQDKTKLLFGVCPPADQVVKGQDIALYFLDENVEPSIAEPRRIASPDLLESDAAYKVRAVGFGLDEHGEKGLKQHVDIAIVSKSCNRKQRVDQEKYDCVPGKELVAQSPDFSEDTCQGDSGGPIYIYGGDQYYLVGITSRGIRNGKCHDGGIYTLITPEVVKWIQSKGVNVQVGPPSGHGTL